MVTGGFKGLQKVTKSLTGLEGVTGGYKGLKRVTKGLQGVTSG